MSPADPAPGRTDARPYRFGDIVVDPAAHTLLRAGVEQPVEPKAFAVLLALLQRPGELIERDDLIDQVWGHHHVTPGVLTRVIAQLRHALDDDPHQPRYILTRHALGYCFIGELQHAPESGAGDPPGADPAPPAESLADREVATPRAQAPAAQAWRYVEPRAGTETAPPSRWRLSWLSLAVLLAIAVAIWSVSERGSHPAAGIANASIAVMPFTSLSNDHHDDYFAAGLTEEMRNALSSVDGLKVAASISPAVRSKASDAKALGAMLGVASILDASVRREGSRLRISARLSDTRTGFTLWSHTYDRRLSDVFATQTEIANDVVRSLLGAIPGEEAALRKRLTPTHNEAAFDSYLQGLDLLHHGEQAGAVDKAVAHFGQALKQDNAFALAQAGICRAGIWRFANVHSADAFYAARNACERAAQMDPSNPMVDLALGDLYRDSGDLARALEHYRKGTRDPATRVLALVGLAKVHARQGNRQQALEEFNRALQLSPGDAHIYAEIGYQHYLDGDIAQALAAYRTAARLQPGDAQTLATLGAMYMETGDDEAASRALEHAVSIEPTADALSNLGLLKSQAGDYAAAVGLQRRAIALDPGDYILWGNLAEALEADPEASTTAAGDAYREAASRVRDYLKLKPADTFALASLGLYNARLGDAARARELVRQSESSPAQPGEVALLNAETLGVLGDIASARERLATARAKGIVEHRITSNPAFRSLGLLSPAGPAHTPGPAKSTALRKHEGRPPGG